MIRRPPISTRTVTLFPSPTLVRSHHLSARRAALDRDFAGAGIAPGDQPPGNIDEIVEGVFALAGLAREIPRPPQIIAAANMRDGIDHAPVDEAEPRRGESRRDAVDRKSTRLNSSH